MRSVMSIVENCCRGTEFVARCAWLGLSFEPDRYLELRSRSSAQDKDYGH